MKRKHINMCLLAGIILILLFGLCGCDSDKNDDSKEKTEHIVIGFSQLGAESDWRSANSNSMISTFTKSNGYELIFEDGQQSQAKQITAIRRFIQQGVDYIVLAPVTEDGWDNVLNEAREAGIPVIVVDRMVDVKDDNLYISWVGSNFELEGKKAAEWLRQYLIINKIDDSEIHIADLQGTIGASAQLGRTRGIEAAAEKYGWDIVAEESAEFTQNKGREVMTALLKEHSDINVVYCENDNSAFGAIEAIEASGRVAGSDIKNGEIMVISFDGVNVQALDYVKEGKISCIGECNPLHGPRVEQIIKTIEMGEKPSKKQFVTEQLYSFTDEIKQVTIDGVAFDVTYIGSDEEAKQ